MNLGQTDFGITESIIWQSGEDGLESYYVYGLTTLYDGRILAFAEGRISRADKDPHHIVCKTSNDGGVSWSANQYVVQSLAGETFSNPTPVYDRETQTVFLFYGQNHDNESASLFVIHSIDGGRTWSLPRNLTLLFAKHPASWTLHLPGPGHGLQLRSGRLILPVWHRGSLKQPADKRGYGISIVYSDDHGASWRNGGIIPPGTAQLNESRLVELANGDLLLNARSGAFVTTARYSSRSADGGFRWSEPERIKSLPPSFATDSSFMNLPASTGDVLIFVRPDAAEKRADLSVYQSFDQGASWELIRRVYSGPAGYSDTVRLRNGEIGLIYGRDVLEAAGNVEGNIKTTVFARFKRGSFGER